MPKRCRNICSRLQRDNAQLWRFVQRDDIPLTNNAAERELRPYVIWRKCSYGAQSAQGDQFRPKILTVLQTAKKWQLGGLEVLREICTDAVRHGKSDFKFPFNTQLKQ